MTTNPFCAFVGLPLLRGRKLSGVIEFYRRLGYAVDDVIGLGKRLERDDIPSA